MNPNPSPSPLVVQLVSESDWWDAPLFAVLAGLLGAVLGSLISLWAASRSEAAQNRRQARTEVFAGFEEIAQAHSKIMHLADFINDGDSRHAAQSSNNIDAARPAIAMSARRVRIYDAALRKPVEQYEEKLDALRAAYNGRDDEYRAATTELSGAYSELEAGVARRVGV